MKSVIFIVLGLTCLPFVGLGLYEVYENEAALARSSRAEGTVTGNRYSTTNVDGAISGAYHPVVEFVDARGEKIIFTDGIGSLPPDYEAGARVEVVFTADEPQKARIYSWKRFWAAPAIFLTVGLLPLIIAFVVMSRLRL